MDRRNIYNEDLELIKFKDYEFDQLTNFSKHIYKLEKLVKPTPVANLGWPIICCSQAFKYLNKLQFTEDIADGIGYGLASMELSYSCMEYCKEQYSKIVKKRLKELKSCKKRKFKDKRQETFNRGILGKFKEKRRLLIHQDPKRLKKEFFKGFFYNENFLQKLLNTASKGLEAAYIARQILSKVEMLEMNQIINDGMERFKKEHNLP